MRRRVPMVALVVTGAALAGAAAAAPPAPIKPRSGSPGPLSAAATAAAVPGAAGAAARYRDDAARILDAAAHSDGAWAKLAHLTDRIGHRLAGSAALEEAVRWAATTLLAEGHEAVRTEPVKVPHWVRGDARAEVLTPARRPLPVLALGGSVGTPAAGITAEVVVAHSFEELDALGAAVKGKIVLFDHAMPPYGPDGSGYGTAVEYRWRGPSAASKHGAIAMLLRSVTARSLGTLHTGSTSYRGAPKKIPAAAVTAEDAAWLSRLVAAGERPRVRLVLGAKTLPDADSANVLAELRGRERPDEIVVIGAHLDSWDVGTGAHDDGAGVAMMMEALSVLRRLDLHPRRTIRVVLFTNEENGLRGAKGYAAAHAAELPLHVAAIEADSGAFAPRGFTLDAAPGEEDDPETLPASVKAAAEGVRRRIEEIATLLAPVGATRVRAGGGGADIGVLGDRGRLPLLGFEVDGSLYFDYHHSAADTLDKVDPAHLRACTGAIAVMAYVLADMPERLMP